MTNNRGGTKGEKWLDIGTCGWLVRFEHSDTWLDFVAYEALGENGNNGMPDDGMKVYRQKGCTNGNDFVTDPGQAEETITGFVKWDGCSEMVLGHPHFCGRRDVAAFAEVMVAIHDLARDTIPKFDREVGE